MGKTTKTTQENKPPEWARPALERAGQDAMALYDQGAGYDTYRGPTMAPMSDVTLGGMNNLLAATGYQGAPVSNETVSNMVPNVEAIMAEILKNKPKVQLPQPQQQPQQLWGRQEEEYGQGRR